MCIRIFEKKKRKENGANKKCTGGIFVLGFSAIVTKIKVRFDMALISKM